MTDIQCNTPDPVEVAEFLEFLCYHSKAWEPQAIPCLKQKFGLSYEQAKVEWDAWVASVSISGVTMLIATHELPDPRLVEKETNGD